MKTFLVFYSADNNKIGCMIIDCESEDTIRYFTKDFNIIATEEIIASDIEGIQIHKEIDLYISIK